jgi:hypothetical protein
LAFSKGFSQSQITLEQIQIYSTTQPKLNYWRLPEDISSIENALDTGLFKKLNLQRNKQFKTIRKELTKQNQVGKINVDWGNSRDIPFHAYLEIYELDPTFAYQNKIADISENELERIQSIWAVSCSIFNQKHEKAFQRTISIGMIPTQSLGIGYPINIVPTTPPVLQQALCKGIGMLGPELDEMEYIEGKVSMAYATDNYWMPIVHNKPRTLFDTSKQFINYPSSTGIQLLRIPSAVLNKIDFKNKSANYRYKSIAEKIKKYRTGINSKEFYQVIQPLRDVNNNKDYTIEAYLEFNPNAAENISFIKQQPLIFIPELTHTIYEGKDSIGQFKESDYVLEKDKFFTVDQFYNGYDSTKKYKLGTNNGFESITHQKEIEGMIYNQPFSIKIGALNQQRTILLNNKIVLVVEGLTKPHQMVECNTSISQELKNLLLLIAYGEIFQSPN